MSIAWTIGVEQAGGGGHPVAHRRAGQLDAVPLEDPFLAVKRQVVGILADGHVGQQSRAGQPLLDRLGEPLGDHDVGLARLAGVLGPDVLEHDQRGRHVFELLADLLAEARAARRHSRGRAAASSGTSWTIRLRGRFAGKGLRPWPLAGGFAAAGGCGLGLGRRLGLRRGGFEDLRAKSKSWSGSSFSDLRP